MRRTRFDDWDCPVARTTDLLGDWWTPLVIRTAFLGARRFDDFVGVLGIPRNVLTERLGRLVDEGVMERRRYQERPERFEYRLTDKGADLFELVVAMLTWGNRWTDWPDGPPVELVDRATGRPLDPVLVDRTTGEEIDPRRTTAAYAEGRGRRAANYGRPA